MSKSFSKTQELETLLDETHPQVILAAFQKVDDADAALFLLMLKTASDALAAHAGKIFAQLPFEKQVSIAEKVIAMEVVESERAKQLWDILIGKIQEAREQNLFLGEGAGNLAKLLSHADIATQSRLLEALGDRQPEVVNSVEEQLFPFDELARLGDEAIATILHSLDTSTLALALHNAPAAIRDRFVENMSASQAEAIEAAAAQLTFEQTQLVDTARQSVVNLVRNFAAKGMLKI